MEISNKANISSLNSNIIDGSNSQTNDQLFYVATGKNYIKKVDSGSFAEIKQSGNFYYNTNPLGSTLSDILDGGDSRKDTSQFIAPIVGGVFPTTKSGI